MRARREPRRRPCSTTRISSTPSQRRARSIDAAAPRARREPRLGSRRLRRPAVEPHARSPPDHVLGAGRRAHRDRDRRRDSRRRAGGLGRPLRSRGGDRRDRKSTRLNSSHANISYAVFCLKKKKKTIKATTTKKKKKKKKKNTKK